MVALDHADLPPEIYEAAGLPPEVLAYRPRCPGCTPEKATAAGGRPCSFYDCTGLPGALRVTCELCMYDFAADDGQLKCDHRTCPTAIRLRANVPIYRAWVELVRAELAGG